jgi:NADH-quinone oxidoreductase subunit N
MSPLALDLVNAWPEILLSGGLCLVLLVDMFLKDSQRDFSYLLTILLLAGTAWVLLGDGDGGQAALAFGGSYISDPLARVLKLFAVAVVATVFLYSRPYLRVRGLHHGEFYVLGLFGLLARGINSLNRELMRGNSVAISIVVLGRTHHREQFEVIATNRNRLAV